MLRTTRSSAAKRPNRLLHHQCAFVPDRLRRPEFLLAEARSTASKALDGLERAGVLISRAVGTTREYEFNPRYALCDELRALLTKALSLYPARLREELQITRKRPRRKGKPR
jgi:hypothetical protein